MQNFVKGKLQNSKGQISSQWNIPIQQVILEQNNKIIEANTIYKNKLIDQYNNKESKEDQSEEEDGHLSNIKKQRVAKPTPQFKHQHSEKEVPKDIFEKFNSPDDDTIE